MSEEELAEVQKNSPMSFKTARFLTRSRWHENVAFGLRQLHKYDDRKTREIASKTLSLVGLSGIEKMKPSELSGGMRKRVAIARAVAMSPKYLFYDEPTTGLDPIMSDVINDLIVSLHEKLGTTGVAITHDMKSAYKISSRIAMLYDGLFVEVDRPEAIQNSKDPLVHKFITGSAEGHIHMKLRAND